MNARPTAEPKAPPAGAGVGAYRTGTAARLAGIPVETLRIWERRYAVVGPRLSAGRQRLYTSADIRRLALVKQLVDLGHAIGAVAPLDDAALAAMREDVRALGAGRKARRPRAVRVALVGPMLASSRLTEALGGTSLLVAGRCADPERASADLSGAGAEVVVIELPTLGDADLERIAAIKSACGAAGAVALYRYAPGAVVRRLRLAGHVVARATSDPQEIEALCLALARGAPEVPSAAPGEPAPPRFDEATLARLAGAARTVECECPQHLVDLVMSLSGFERYSAECESRNPADAALHHYLKDVAGNARAMLEAALLRVVEAEGISLPA
jgi:DNA-binding transcriptional MerR regulator